MKGKQGCRSVASRHLFFYVVIIVIMIASIIMLAACDDTDTASIGNDNESSNTDNNVPGNIDNDDDNKTDVNTPNNGDTIDDDKENNGSDNNKPDDTNKPDTNPDDTDDDNTNNELKEMSIRVTDTFFIYDGLYHGIIIDGIPDGASIEYVGEREYKNAGKYEIKAKITLEGYKDKEIVGKLEIAKRKLDDGIISFEDVTCVWDGEEHCIEVKGELPDEITVTYTNNGKTEVGEYEIVASFDTHGNYEDIAEMKAILRINEKLYDVRFKDDSGDTVIRVAHGNGITDMPDITPRRGYTSHWDDTDLSEVTENKTVYAVYVPIKYSVEYDLNGGINSARNPEEYTVEDGYIELCAPYRDGYLFLCWRDEDGEAVSGINSELLLDLKLSAEWEAVNYEILYELNGGDNDERNATSYTIKDDEIVLYDAHKDWFSFGGWYEDEDFSGERVTAISGAQKRKITLYAKWESIYEVSEGVIVGYNYSFGKDVVIPYEIDGEKIVGIANGVLQGARKVEIKAELSEIGADMFAGCTLLEELNMGSAIGSIADGALRDCVSLAVLTVPYMGLGANDAIDGKHYPIAALFGDEERDGFYDVIMTPTLIGDGGEEYDSSVERKRYVPNTLKEITVLGGVVLGYGMEGLSSVEKISVHADEIRRFAFRNCERLQELRIFGEVEEINNTALMGCEALRFVYVESESVAEFIRAAISKARLTDIEWM
ncbi:MAG: InlB B-repeat-containing protein [Clostridia bacterium]|nr:InlB B-repeat-containing protein [Clostridia bacterium]